MRWNIRRCLKCREYTLKDICPRCNIGTISPIPAKFSPQDKYSQYRIPKLNRNEDHDNRGNTQTY